MLAAGMDDYITKPIRMEELTQALARAEPLGGTGPHVLDPAVLQALVASFGDRGGESVAELIDTFLGNRPDHMASLRDAFERGDSDEARRVAHTLKSNAATFGASTLAELSRDVEAQGRAGSLEGASQLLDRLEGEFRRVEAALREARKRLAP